MAPTWAPDGALLFISDRSGWWNLYHDGGAGGAAALCAREAEFGGPAWVFGMRPFQPLPDGRCAVRWTSCCLLSHSLKPRVRVCVYICKRCEDGSGLGASRVLGQACCQVAGDRLLAHH